MRISKANSSKHTGEFTVIEVVPTMLFMEGRKARRAARGHGRHPAEGLRGRIAALGQPWDIGEGHACPTSCEDHAGPSSGHRNTNS